MNITLTDEQIEALQKGEDITISAPCKKVEIWEPKGGGWYIDSLGEVCRGELNAQSQKFGVEYQTKKQAEKAGDLMRSHHRQIAWLIENDDGWVADWKDCNQPKYHIWYDHSNDSFEYDRWWVRQSINTISMSESNTKKLVKLLNDGIVEF